MCWTQQWSFSSYAMCEYKESLWGAQLGLWSTWKGQEDQNLSGPHFRSVHDAWQLLHHTITDVFQIPKNHMPDVRGLTLARTWQSGRKCLPVFSAISTIWTIKYAESGMAPYKPMLLVYHRNLVSICACLAQKLSWLHFDVGGLKSFWHSPWHTKWVLRKTPKSVSVITTTDN